MTNQRAAGVSHQIKGKAKEQWGKLNDDELKRLEGHAERLAGKLQQRYGRMHDEAERQGREFRRQMNWN